MNEILPWPKYSIKSTVRVAASTVIIKFNQQLSKTVSIKINIHKTGWMLDWTVFMLAGYIRNVFTKRQPFCIILQNKGSIKNILTNTKRVGTRSEQVDYVQGSCLTHLPCCLFLELGRSSAHQGVHFHPLHVLYPLWPVVQLGTSTSPSSEWTHCCSARLVVTHRQWDNEVSHMLMNRKHEKESDCCPYHPVCPRCAPEHLHHRRTSPPTHSWLQGNNIQCDRS